MQQPWRFVDTGARDAASNMALDEALLVRHEAGATPPTLRVYGWCQPTLSLGYAQNAQQEVDLAACHTQGVAVIRRPTGGRAVLHDQEVTYSVVMPLLWMMVRPPSRSTIVVSAWRWRRRCRPGSPGASGAPPGTGRADACPSFAGLLCCPVALRAECGRQKNGRQCPEACPACPAATWLYTPVDGPATAVPVFAGATRAPCRVRAGRLPTMGAVNEVAAGQCRWPRCTSLTPGVWRHVWGRIDRHAHSPEEWHLAQHLRATKYVTDAWN